MFGFEGPFICSRHKGCLIKIKVEVARLGGKGVVSGKEQSTLGRYHVLCDLSPGIVLSEPLCRERVRMSFQFVGLGNR